ncbi:hypothetical protein BKA56DRAFT_675829 [Ilyonectria sp. MPI-CAGE-AT-0026]|nr:hypothetical protein BKA56DRAFT_675829 [Ilyonectria sp. MPI-CAGE-AT-0026]
MADPTGPRLDIDMITPACVVWECDNSTHTLIDPDPATRDVLLKLKGIKPYTSILGWIPPTDVTSFSFEMYPCPPELVRQKLNCNVIRLRFDLSQPLRLVAPAEATEPVRPRKRRSADVCSTLCSLARVKALDIHVSDKQLPAVKLKAFSLAVRQSALQPFDADFPTTLASLYAGSGGKLIDDVSALRNHPDHQEMDKQAQQDGQLDTEKLKKLEERVKQLENGNKELSDEVDVLRANCEKGTDGVHDHEAALLETQDDLDELKERVDFLLQNGLDSEVEEDMVQRVTDRATTNLLNKSYSFSVNES